MNFKMILADSMSALTMTITILVIICMAISFTLLFYFYVINKKKLVILGAEDEKIKTQIEKDYSAFLRKKQVPSYDEFLKYKTHRKKIMRIASDVIYGIIIVFLLAIAITGLVYRKKGEQLQIGKTTHLIIQTGSMAEKNKLHAYYDSLPNNQIQQYAWIEIEQTLEKDLNIFDIIAFKYDGVVYVHRIVKITETNEKRSYTTQGDANSGSLAFELEVDYEQIIGRYNGKQSLGKGVFFTYLQSGIGITAFLFATAMIILIDLSEFFLYKSIYQRYIYLVKQKKTEGEDDEI